MIVPLDQMIIAYKRYIEERHAEWEVQYEKFKDFETSPGALRAEIERLKERDFKKLSYLEDNLAAGEKSIVLNEKDFGLIEYFDNFESVE